MFFGNVYVGKRKGERKRKRGKSFFSKIILLKLNYLTFLFAKQLFTCDEIHYLDSAIEDP